MNWWHRLFGRDPGDKDAQRESARLAAASAETLSRADRLIAERKRLVVAVRNTTAALQAEGRR